MTSKTEQLARDLMQHFHPELEVTYGVRPAWLQNPATKQALELDIFFPDLQVALEIQGSQHNRYTPGLHASEDAFTRQLARDTIKVNRCAEWGVRLYHLDAFHMTRTEFPKFLRRFEEDNRLQPNRGVGEPTALYATADRLCRMRIRTPKNIDTHASVFQRFWAWLWA
jgi:hypothetical protein